MTNRLFGIGTVACISLLACSGEEGQSRTAEPTRATLMGVFKNDNFVDPPQISDGIGDAQLTRAKRLRGFKRFIPITSPEPRSELERAGVAVDDVKISSRLLGLVTPQGHYILEFDTAVLPSTLGMTAEPGSVVERGWSNGTDGRLRITGASIPQDIGQTEMSAGGKCSGALIGRRIVRTAAHCVIKHTTGGGSPSATVTFRQARDETTWRASDATPTYYYGGAYIGTGCGTSTAASYSAGYDANLDACNWADWAYLVLATDWYSEAGSVHWWGFKSLTASDLGMTLTSYGYPGCDDKLVGGVNDENVQLHDPSGCRTHANAAYRHNGTRCEVGSWLSMPARWKVGCDASPGNSGGPVLQRDTGYVIGHAQTEECGTCTASDNYPNRYLGHDDYLYNLQLDLRADYP